MEYRFDQIVALILMLASIGSLAIRVGTSRRTESDHAVKTAFSDSETNVSEAKSQAEAQKRTRNDLWFKISVAVGIISALYLSVS